jgi:hypothetical protein
MKARIMLLLFGFFFSSFFHNVPDALADGKYPVRITEQNLIVFPVDEKTLQAVQITTFKNNGTNKETELPVYLPSNYSELEMREGLDHSKVRTTEKGIVDAAGLEPGEEKRMVLSYLMPMDKKTSLWKIEQSYVTERFQVVIPAGVLSFEAGNLVTQSELLEMNGREFRRFTRVDVHPDEPWILSFRLLEPSQENANQTEGALEKETHPEENYTSDGKKIYGHEHGAGYTKAVITLIIVFIALSIALIGLRQDQGWTRRRRSSHSLRPWLLPEKENLLRQVGQLEQDFASKIISQETYEAAKKQIRDRLIRVTLEIRRENSG